MDNRRILHMPKSEGARNLICPREYILFGQECFIAACFNHQCAQIVAGDVIHDEIIAWTVGEEIRHLGKIGMIETRKNSCLAQKLIAGFFAYIFREGTIVFDFLQSTLATLETNIVCKVNGSHATLPNALADLIATAQYLPSLERREQS